ncbi:MFS transporter [Carbonactinospora thermoautotrophica]|uniref:MFS transporter n=1 Tax=Carbonactinospora thermoautotrophica TaxID=1469144 RepID=UPI002270DB07|nr:MFS transporter [Carbonactinospora thermoautotrophica]MCX9191253.1 MFS transporter [Carbonactinospora thermoautotrophica]
MPLTIAAVRDLSAVQRRTVRSLASTQVLGGVGVSVGIAMAALLAQELSGSPNLSGLAATASTLGAAVAAVPLAGLMARRGRRPGLMTGYLAGSAGSALAVVAAALGSYPLLLVGMLLFGAATTSNLQARYAATDLAEPTHRGRALSVVVWATTIGAVAGPNLVAPAGAMATLLGLPRLAGPFLWSAIVFLLAGAVMGLLLRPDPLLLAQRHAADTDGPRPSARAALGVVRRTPRAALGLVGIAVGHMIMVGVMSLTPVHIHSGEHPGPDMLRLVGLVISVHVAGMYAFSPVVGWLADRFGRVWALAGAQGVLYTSLLLAGTAQADETVQLTAGLFLLGLGWSGCLVAGSTLLSESVPIGVRAGAQGASDLVMGVCGATGGAFAGLVVGLAGYSGLNASAGVVLTLLTALTIGTACRK